VTVFGQRCKLGHQHPEVSTYMDEHVIEFGAFAGFGANQTQD
jgi:hypothetical protein